MQDISLQKFLQSISPNIRQATVDMGWDTNNQIVKITSMWSIINKKDSFNERHHHGNSALSAAYYVNADENSGDIVDIGAYEFSTNECSNDTTPPVIEMSDCGGSGCSYEYEINSTFDVNDIEPPIVNDNCDSDISYDVSHNVDTSTVGVYFVTFTASDNSGDSASTQVEVTIFDPLSISENNFEIMFVYPNPVKDILNIQNVYSNSTISLSDIIPASFLLLFVTGIAPMLYFANFLIASNN